MDHEIEKASRSKNARNSKPRTVLKYGMLGSGAPAAGADLQVFAVGTRPLIGGVAAACAVAAVCTVVTAGIALAQQKPAPAVEPVKLGLILDMSGPYADVSGLGSETAVRMAVGDFGAKVLGRPIEVLAADHQNKPDVAAAIAKKWFDIQHVTALMDVGTSNASLAVMGVAKSRHRIVILNTPATVSITNEGCIPTAVHYVYDTYAMAQTIGKAVVAQGGKTWFFITSNFTFGHHLEADTAAVVKAAGGRVLGNSLVPLGTTDFASYLLRAQHSGAQVIGLAVAGTDLINALKQASEFGLDQTGQRLTGLLVFINEVHSLGLRATQGMVLASAFYWDRDDASQQFAQRFFERLHKMPDMLQAGVYSATMHYLQAVQKAGTTDAGPVMREMRAAPINDFFAHNGHIRADGRMVHDMYLFQVKTPAESKSPWDLYKLSATVPGDQAFQPLSKSKCLLVKQASRQ
jgi:branched-chain amino acid transport system substrate-binding protein